MSEIISFTALTRSIHSSVRDTTDALIYAVDLAMVVTVIIWKKDQKQWASFNLREDWNAVNIGLLLDYVSKNGL